MASSPPELLLAAGGLPMHCHAIGKELIVPDQLDL